MVSFHEDKLETIQESAEHTTSPIQNSNDAQYRFMIDDMKAKEHRFVTNFDKLRE